MLSRAMILAPVFVALQAGGVYWIAGTEHPPALLDFTAFPKTLGTWQKAYDDPIDPETIAQLRADRTLNTTYSSVNGYGPNAETASLFVAWFQSQRGGASQPHSPQVCLPANGWVPVVTDQLSLGESLPINRYIVSLGQQRAVVLYWYQTPHRVMASEWVAKFWVMADAVKDKRTDTSLVRVVVFNGSRSDEQTTAVAMDFARNAYPALHDIFSR
jgi:EpsI family protein